MRVMSNCCILKHIPVHILTVGLQCSFHFLPKVSHKKKKIYLHFVSKFLMSLAGAALSAAFRWESKPAIHNLFILWSEYFSCKSKNEKNLRKCYKNMHALLTQQKIPQMKVSESQISVQQKSYSVTQIVEEIINMMRKGKQWAASLWLPSLCCPYFVGRNFKFSLFCYPSIAVRTLAIWGHCSLPKSMLQLLFIDYSWAPSLLEFFNHFCSGCLSPCHEETHSFGSSVIAYVTSIFSCLLSPLCSF